MSEKVTKIQEYLDRLAKKPEFIELGMLKFQVLYQCGIAYTEIKKEYRCFNCETTGDALVVSTVGTAHYTGSFVDIYVCGNCGKEVPSLNRDKKFGDDIQ